MNFELQPRMVAETLLQKCPYGKCTCCSETVDLVETWDPAISG